MSRFGRRDCEWLGEVPSLPNIRTIQPDIVWLLIASKLRKSPVQNTEISNFPFRPKEVTKPTRRTSDLRRSRELTQRSSPEVDHLGGATMNGHARCPEETVPDLPAMVPARR
jgi:hypothetical protein